MEKNRYGFFKEATIVNGALKVNAVGGTGGDTIVNNFSLETVVIPANSTVTLVNTTRDNGVNIYYTEPGAVSILPIAGTTDVGNISSDDANLINGNYTDLCYNNTSQISANKETVGIVYTGDQSLINGVRITFWNVSSYGSTNFKLQGSSDNITWTDIVTNLNSNNAVNIPSVGPRLDVTSPLLTLYSSFRLFVITPNNTQFFAIAEMELLSATGIPTNVNILQDGSNITQIINANDVQLVNSGNAAVTIKSYYIA